MEPTISAAIKKSMRSGKISYEKLASDTGINVSRLKRSLSNYSSQSLSLADLQKICKALNLELFIIQKNNAPTDNYLKLSNTEKRLLSLLLKSLSGHNNIVNLYKSKIIHKDT
ncbi:helix-turn-helix domain-containing protein [Enterobacter chuandaensis]